MSTQNDWASCAKCQGFFYAPLQGKCPAGGEHDQTNSFHYAVDYNIPANGNIQTGWASCPKCQGMHFAGFPTKGVCPAGGQHAETGSFAYALRHDLAPAPNLQVAWNACHKCLGLFYGPFKGKCPAGGTHDPQGSYSYCLPFTSVTDLPSIDAAYRRRNGAYGRLGPLVGALSRNPDGSFTQNTAFGKLHVQDATGNTPVAADTFYDVSVGLQAVKCFGTLANWPDDTDALYAVVSVVPYGVSTTIDGTLGAPVTTRTQIADIKKGEIKLQDVPIGRVVPGGNGVYVYISLWQHKSGDPDKIRDTIHAALNDLANQVSDVAQGLAGADTGGTAGDISNQKIAGVSIDDLTLGLANAITNQFFADRLIASHTYNVYLDQVKNLADQTFVTRSEYTDPDLTPDIRVNWPPSPAQNPLLSGGGASYKAYFMVLTSVVTTPVA